MIYNNGILLKADASSPPFWVRLFSRYSFESGGFKICSWHNCLGLRKEILYFISPLGGKESYNYYKLNKYDVHGLRALLRNFNCKKVWNRYSGSFQTYKKIKWALRKHRLALFLLEQQMKIFPNTEVYFYDI